MQFAELVAASREAAATRSRLKKRAALSACLRQAPSERLHIVVDYLTGHLPQGKIGLGPALLKQIAADNAAAHPALTIEQVDEAFDALAGIKGAGSQTRRRERLQQLFDSATAEEQDFLLRLMLGELRQGALEGVLADAIADAAGLSPEPVRRAAMLAGRLSEVATAAMESGLAGLAQFRLHPFTPVQPMLASPSEDMVSAMTDLASAVLEYKIDGARVQIHRSGGEVRVYSRQLNEVTASVPEVTELTLALPARSLVLDGEVVALRADGRPLPFQDTMRRFGRRADVEAMRAELPLSLYLFDCLHLDGEDLIDRPLSERHRILEDLAGADLQVPRCTTSEAQTAQSFLERALGEGHEGVMAKNPASQYAAGSRGSDWLKVKQVHTFDLVVLAAEWGSGRRKGWLSNLHLGARDRQTGGFVMLGKTFKGLTDGMLEWQTNRLLDLSEQQDGHVVTVRPELVVEIAVNEIQASPHYPAGMALRFARVKAYRHDKPASEADTVDSVRALFEKNR